MSECETLAHNGDSYCAEYIKHFPKPNELLEIAAKLGQKDTYVHAHHIVQKVGTGFWGKIYSARSRQILTDAGIDILYDPADIARVGKEGCHNMCYALNGQGTHTVAAQRKVWLPLEEAKNKAIKQKRDVSQAVKDELAWMREEFQNGRKFWE